MKRDNEILVVVGGHGIVSDYARGEKMDEVVARAVLESPYKNDDTSLWISRNRVGDEIDLNALCQFSVGPIYFTPPFGEGA